MVLGGALVVANCSASSSGGTAEQREEGGRRSPARFTMVRQTRAKRPGEASSCFTMSREQVHVHTWRHDVRAVVIGSKQVKQIGRQAGDASALLMTETVSFSSLDLLIPLNNSKNLINKSCSP